MLLISVDLPEPDTPVTQVSRPIGISRSTLLQVVAARAFESAAISFLLRGVRLAGTAIFTPARQVLAGQRIRMRHDLLRRALRHDLAAMHARTRTDIDHIVGLANRVLVVLDHDHRVAEVAQVLQRVEQPFVIALMQANGRLVENVHHADQPGADLAGQTNALRFAAGQGVGAAVQRQIVQADIDQELQALADFLEDFVGDFAAPARAASARRRNRKASPIGRLVTAGSVCSSTKTCRASRRSRVPRQSGQGCGAEKLGQFLAHRRRFGFVIAALEVPDDAFERVRAFDDVAAAVEVLEVDILLAAAEQQDPSDVLRQLSNGASRLNRSAWPASGASGSNRRCAGPSRESRPGQRQFAGLTRRSVIEELLHAQAVAGRAGAGRVVEREQPRLELADGRGCRSGRRSSAEKIISSPRLIVHRRDQRDAVRQLQRGFKRFGQALLQVGAHFEAVDDDFDGVLLLLIEFRRLVEFAQLAVDARADETLGAQLFEDCEVFAFALAITGASSISACLPAAPAPRRPSG